jgi:hypothetical protein
MGRRLPLFVLLSLLLPLLTLADPDPQFTNNAPFSGIIYLVDPNGQPVNAASTNFCPSQAPVSCGSIGQPS